MTKREFLREVREATKDQSAGLTIDGILEIPGRVEFMMSLDHYFAPPGGALTGCSWEALLELPDAPRLVLVLSEFTNSLFSGGISLFLVEKRVLLEEALRCCEVVSASQGTEYLSALAGCFAGGVIPATAEECDELIFGEDEGSTRIEHCLNALDEKYAGTYEEVIDCLRRHVAQNRDRFGQAPRYQSPASNDPSGRP